MIPLIFLQNITGFMVGRKYEAAFKVPIEAQYETQGHPFYASARLRDDGVIAPTDTRMTLALVLSASLNAPAEPWAWCAAR